MKIYIASALALISLTACGDDVARQIGTENGQPVYQVFGKTSVPNGANLADLNDTPIWRAERQSDLRAMASAVCPNGYTQQGPSDISLSAWRRGEDGRPFNAVIRETQNVICTQ